MKYSRIPDDTPLMPWVVADRVIAEVETCFPLNLPSGGRAMADKLSDRADAVYAASPRFQRQLKRRDGREVLYAFMRHWLAGELRTRRPSVFRRLPDDFKMGHPLRCPRGG